MDVFFLIHLRRKNLRTCGAKIAFFWIKFEGFWRKIEQKMTFFLALFWGRFFSHDPVNDVKLAPQVKGRKLEKLLYACILFTCGAKFLVNFFDQIFSPNISRKKSDF